jgi:hypothetical protein
MITIDTISGMKLISFNIIRRRPDIWTINLISTKSELYHKNTFAKIRLMDKFGITSEIGLSGIGKKYQ